MKRISKMLVCIMCVFALAVPTVMADINDVMFDLESLGVLEDMSKPSDMNGYITRGEFTYKNNVTV